MKNHYSITQPQTPGFSGPLIRNHWSINPIITKGDDEKTLSKIITMIGYHSCFENNWELLSM